MAVREQRACFQACYTRSHAQIMLTFGFSQYKWAGAAHWWDLIATSFLFITVVIRESRGKHHLEEVLLLKELRALLGVEAAAQVDKSNIVPRSGSHSTSAVVHCQHVLDVLVQVQSIFAATLHDWL